MNAYKSLIKNFELWDFLDYLNKKNVDQGSWGEGPELNFV